MSIKSCHYFPLCQGCSHWDKSYDDQKNSKIKHLENLLVAANLKFPTIEFHSCGEQGLRQRVDFTIHNAELKQMGFYDQNKALIDVKECLQLSPALQRLYDEFRTISFPISKGSVRLRVGPSGIKGCWLDFSNLDIKNLLAEKITFAKLFEKDVHIEVGQKGKSVTLIDGEYKLKDPVPRIWFETYDSNGQAIPLRGLISDFTQPSWQTAQKLVETVLGWSRNSKGHAIEFGPGLGQFTLPLLASGFTVSVFESDASAVQSLKQNAMLAHLEKNLHVTLGDFQSKSLSEIPPTQLALVNPPRSGLKKFTGEVIKTGSEKCIYISCFPETMVTDLKVFSESGYQITDVWIVDQFPQTRHYEACVQLSKN